ncbi:aspartate dehydrogenase [Roseibium sp. MMSF_3412]|uniref:aspartate dehydrogenase n=1 Tax=Roseibium sp. MMSF_3412 TaxID=3046712 RepID=UPI00273F66CB|nr:aspartate dehydrogenase [Roseibium sp. MMSF_3412]
MLKIGIAGTGAIGLAVARAMSEGGIPGCKLVAISARNAERANEIARAIPVPVRFLTFAGLAEECDVIVEALPPEKFGCLARPVLENGKVLVALSASQLLGRDDLIDLAAGAGGRILVPSGAMLGLDAIKAVSQGKITSITIETRKPVAGLVNAPYLHKNGLDLAGITEAVCILAGSVTEVAREFPANVNVAAALSLAGIGPNRSRMEIWADPALNRNMHTVRVASDSSDFTMQIQNRPSVENPATGRITPQSVIALLKDLTAVMRIGT